jgi:hypothetical protein
VVFDRTYGEKLAKLALTSEVWVIESEPNQKAAEDLWHAAEQWPQISVTIFRAPEVPTEETWTLVLNQLQLQRPGSRRPVTETIEVIGSEATDDARRALAALGFETISLTREGFRAAK